MQIRLSAQALQPPAFPGTSHRHPCQVTARTWGIGESGDDGCKWCIVRSNGMRAQPAGGARPTGVGRGTRIPGDRPVRGVATRPGRRPRATAAGTGVPVIAPARPGRRPYRPCSAAGGAPAAATLAPGRAPRPCPELRVSRRFRCSAASVTSATAASAEPAVTAMGSRTVRAPMADTAGSAEAAVAEVTEAAEAPGISGTPGAPGTVAARGRARPVRCGSATGCGDMGGTAAGPAAGTGAITGTPVPAAVALGLRPGRVATPLNGPIAGNSSHTSATPVGHTAPRQGCTRMPLLLTMYHSHPCVPALPQCPKFWRSPDKGDGVDVPGKAGGCRACAESRICILRHDDAPVQGAQTLGLLTGTFTSWTRDFTWLRAHLRGGGATPFMSNREAPYTPSATLRRMRPTLARSRDMDVRSGTEREHAGRKGVPGPGTEGTTRRRKRRRSRCGDLAAAHAHPASRAPTRSRWRATW